MFFSLLARLVASIALIFSALQVALGFAIASGSLGPKAEALARYTSASTSGEVIDRGIYGVVFAIALGALAEIAIILRRLERKKGGEPGATP